MTTARDVIGQFLQDDCDIEQGYRAADALIARLVKSPFQMATLPVEVTDFVGRGDDAGLLRQVADWLEDENRVLLGLWSTGFGNVLETTLQVITEPDKPTKPAAGEEA